MKNHFFFILLFLGISFVFAAGTVYAAPRIGDNCTSGAAPTKDDAGNTLVCVGGSWLAEIPQGPQTAGQVIKIIETIATWVFAIFLAVSVIFLVVGAFQFVTARGDPAQVNKAREILLYSIIGIGLAFLANAVDDVLRFLLT